MGLNSLITHTGANKGAYNYGVYSKAEMAGTGGYDGVFYGGYLEGRYSGSGTNASWSSLYGSQSKAKVNTGSSGDLGYVIGNNVSAEILSATADVQWLQGQHTTVKLTDGNISGAIAVNMLDFDYVAGNVDGDFAYLQIQQDPFDYGSFVTGTARAINSDSALPSVFAGSVEASTLKVSGGTGDEGTLSWNVNEATMDLQSGGVTYQLGQEVAPLVRNSSGSTIVNGTPVMFAGTLGNSGRILVAPAVADGTIPSSYILGVTTEDILNGADGHVTWFGKVRGITTNGSNYGETWSDGDVVYVSPTTAGYLTNVKPQAPNLQIFVGVVVNSHPNNGTLFTRPSWRSSLEDLDDVNGTAATVSGQILVWDNDLSVFDFTSNINDYALKSEGYTVATLPAGVVGKTAYVTDATTPTYLGTLTGGGAVACPVFYNGSAWVSH